MELSKYGIKSPILTLFQTYLLDNPKIKNIAKEFYFYKVLFYREEYAKESIVYIQYPKGNIYWYIDFNKYIKANFLDVPDCIYKEEWIHFLIELKKQVKEEFNELKFKLNLIKAKDIILNQMKYNLRNYQSYDMLQFIQKYQYWNNRGLILSEPRTGKSRVALAATIELLSQGDLVLIVCPKSAEIGWTDEISKMNLFRGKTFSGKTILKISDLKALEIDSSAINYRIISYDLFKKLTIPQIRQLMSKNKRIILIGDEVHRLRNFKTQQSKAIFNFKDICVKDRVDLGIIGLTGTPAVKESYDVFGLLSLINDSKIQFKPYYDSFDCFKEYFYYCVDTSFGKQAKALRREDELNYIIQSCSVQTKQIELEHFKNYTKKYLKITLPMDTEQKKIYNSVYENMEYDEDIDCQNKLVQLIRLQQICIDPFGLVATYANLSPKIKWVVNFAKKNNFKFIVACKKTTPLKHLMEVLDRNGIGYASILGKYSYQERLDQIEKFNTIPDVKCIILQLDTGREALTLPIAYATIFLDRDFAQGYNEQAEARMTPIDGRKCTKYVIDLVMEDSKEEEIYQSLVIKKKSIDAVNLVFKPKEGG